MFLCVFVFVLDEPLQNNFETSSEIFARSLEIFGYYQIPTKNPGTLRIKMSCAYKFNKVGRYTPCSWVFRV